MFYETIKQKSTINPMTQKRITIEMAKSKFWDKISKDQCKYNVTIERAERTVWD